MAVRHRRRPGEMCDVSKVESVWYGQRSTRRRPTQQGRGADPPNVHGQASSELSARKEASWPEEQPRVAAPRPAQRQSSPSARCQSCRPAGWCALRMAPKRHGADEAGQQAHVQMCSPVPATQRQVPLSDAQSALLVRLKPAPRPAPSCALGGQPAPYPPPSHNAAQCSTRRAVDPSSVRGEASSELRARKRLFRSKPRAAACGGADQTHAALLQHPHCESPRQRAVQDSPSSVKRPCPTKEACMTRYFMCRRASGEACSP